MNQTSDLKNGLLLSLLVTDDDQGTVIAAGPLTNQPGSNPYRVVLVDLGDQFVVWTQGWTDKYIQPDGSLCPDPKGSHFDNGDYFRAEDLVSAIQRFGIRVGNHAKFAQSIKRDGDDTPGDWILKAAS